MLNPVALYIDSLETVGWVTPDGTPASQFWVPVRGASGMTVRAVFEVPASKGYVVEDIQIGGQAIKFGGQLAEHINVKLTGIACRQGSFDNEALPCPGDSVGPLALTEARAPARSRLPSRSALGQ